MESAQRSLSIINNQFASNQTMNAGKVLDKSDDDVVIVGMARTAITKGKRGAQKDTAPELMLTPVLQAVIKQANIDPKLVEDVAIGNVLQPGAGATTSRIAMFLAGLPASSSLQAINRQCSSGLQAVMSIANAIRARQIDFGIGGGVESMSLYSMEAGVDPNTLSSKAFEHPVAQNCLMPMGITSENVAEQYKISREKQDQMAFESHQKAARANKEGWAQKEITSYKTMVKDKDGNEKEVLVDRDDGVRAETTLEGLKKLKPAFKKDGTTTAGNSSQVSDGASAVLLTRRDVAKKLGLKVYGRIVSYAVAGVPPEIMGVGPAYAIPAALKKAGLEVKDIDVFEINEAFASQATMSIEALGVPKEKLNPRGGAIAIGHPLGNTGSRQVVTLFHELERTAKRFGVISMCIGTGMGAAGVFERE
ncbi:acetyl-acyltransferases family protein [Stylonychia lemnae]|uniref:acetyl-CoA C-acyltransferase n=1 Tax=Stylonychia lemnae TaxID=5949 RepID=A0A078ASJ2_STYLE|nr:acetyl-acyltransferases family protein [Stylonychia lemnae]|eukprot:CDW85139.1 acetyl-acyltransferases family protein [Stylonychia lemnae]